MKGRLHLSGQNETGGVAEVPSWLWWSVVSLLIIVFVTGFGLVAALALGWRSPTPRRAPDWEETDIQWTAYGEGSTTTSGTTYSMRLSQPEQRGWAVSSAVVSDFDLELDAHSSAAHENVDYGLLFRYQDPDNHYRFGIGSGNRCLPDRRRWVRRGFRFCKTVFYAHPPRRRSRTAGGILRSCELERLSIRCINRRAKRYSIPCATPDIPGTGDAGQFVQAGQSAAGEREMDQAEACLDSE